MKYSIVFFAILHVITANLLRNKCGINPNDKIIRGAVLHIDDYPWTVRLQYEKGDTIDYLCGGVLISKRYVLTQAYCVENLPDNWKLKAVRLGEYNTTSETDCVSIGGGLDCSDPALDISIEEMIVHEHHNNTKLISKNDIALLRLSKDVEFTDFINPICLPKNQEDKYNGNKLVVTGWGKTYQEQFPDVKLQFTLTAMSIEDCNKKYNSRNVVIGDGQFCATGVNTFCIGSAGNPLMLRSNDGWMVVGTESFGTPCRNSAEDRLPTVYTDIGFYLEWIMKHMKA